jgi:methionyl-tRNA formyltransferase
VPSLQALHAAGHDVVLVVTQPDRPGDRMRLTAPPVKAAALELGLPVYQPERIRDPEAVERLRALAPDVIVVVAYGQIIPPSILALARLGVLNVHASLLPRHRGASPVAHAILAGDDITGVTIMRMDEQLDHGPILASREVEINRGEDAAHLTERLAKVGAEVLVETMARLERDRDRVETRAQEESAATVAPRLHKQDGELDWDRPAADIVRAVRAFTPWPGVTLPFRGRRVKVLEAHSREGSAPPGEVVKVEGDWVYVGTREGILVLMKVQLPGGRPMPARALVAGGA